MQNWLMCALSSACLFVMLAATNPTIARAQASDELTAFTKQAWEFYNQGKHLDSAAAAEKALTLAERRFGKEHASTLVINNFLGKVYSHIGRFSAAEQLFKSALDVQKRTLGTKDPATLTTMSALADLYYRQGRYKVSEQLNKTVLRIRERVLGEESSATLQSVNNLAVLYQAQGRLKEAEQLLVRAVTVQERVLGKDDFNALASVGNLAGLYQQLGRYREAETLYRRVLEAKEKMHGKDHPKTLISVNNLASTYEAQGRYAQAEPLMRRALEIREHVLGKDNPATIVSVNNLASLFSSQGRYGEAESLYLRSLHVKKRVLGRDHPDTIRGINNLAFVKQVQGRYREAEGLYRQAFQANERVLGEAHPETLVSLGNLASIYGDQGRFGEAESLYKRALELKVRVLGKEHPQTLISLNSLALLNQDLGRYDEAETLLKRALEAQQRVLGKEHPNTIISLNNLALLYSAQGRYGESEPLHKQALEVAERILGKEHPKTISSINNLAVLYVAQGRHSEAEPLYKRAMGTYERVLGKEHPLTLKSVNNLAVLYVGLKRYEKAKQLLERELKTSERVLGLDHPDTLTSVNNLAEIYNSQGDYRAAEPLYKRALKGQGRTLGTDNPLTLVSLNNLALSYYKQGRYSEAEPLFKRALGARKRVLGNEHPDLAATLDSLAGVYFAQSDWARALEMQRRSTAIIIGRMQFGARATGEILTGKQRSEAERSSFYFSGLVKAGYRLAVQGAAYDGDLARETFQTAQWAQSSEAAQSLAQMASRRAAGNPRLAAIVRERQDLVAEWQTRDRIRNAALAQTADKRDAEVEAENTSRLAAISKRVGEIDKRLAVEFPDFAALASTAPLSVNEVQASLVADEALILFLDTEERKPTPEETFVWVVTKDTSRWLRSELGSKMLRDHVDALRCGLDYEGSWKGTRCFDLLNTVYTDDDHRRGKPLPFDVERAHSVYEGLFGKVADLIKGKDLVIVASGPLAQLPFQVLVTKPPKQKDISRSTFAKASWLTKHHAITVLPSVSSLKALRAHAKTSKANRPFIGFGNPLLDGNRHDRWHQAAAKFARSIKVCAGSDAAPTTNQRVMRKAVSPMERGARLADLTELRAAAALPETANELCVVARAAGARTDEVYLGRSATEARIKSLSETGKLASYKVLHFATHGALAGELKGLAEPGLIMTPPFAATANDDGYLSASEVAGLKLDADWVILSACNTAGGETENAEALSGLAKAFFYAGARSLLVSHWYVDSQATVALITKAFAARKRDPKIGRAGALREAMLAIINEARQKWHPAYWAPFVVVGEGAS